MLQYQCDILVLVDRKNQSLLRQQYKLNDFHGLLQKCQCLRYKRNLLDGNTNLVCKQFANVSILRMNSSCRIERLEQMREKINTLPT